jgi:choline dehydrogenase-like flavoprotein
MGGQPFVARANEVLLSAGTFGSAHLLLLSGVGPADELRRVGIPVVEDRPGVGKNLRCHPSVPLMFRPTEQYAPSSTEPQFQTALHYTARGSSDENDMMLLPMSGMEGMLAISCGVRVPCSVGELQIQSADAATQPSICYDYLHPRDLERLRDGVRLVLELAEDHALERGLSSRLQPSGEAVESDAALDRWIMEWLMTSYHACGTCKLGPPDDEMAVVDERCRLHGVEGLRVVDLSIVPQSVRSGPHATVVMLAERAADLVKTG